MTKSEFGRLTEECTEMLGKVESKIDRVTVDLTLKFSKEVQLKLYKDMNQVFFKLKTVEAEMIEIAH